MEGPAPAAVARDAAVAARLASRVAGEGHADLSVAPVVQRMVLVALVPHVARAPGIRALPAKPKRLSPVDRWKLPAAQTECTSKSM